MDNTNVRKDQPLQGGQQNISGQKPQNIQEHISDEAWEQLDSEGRATYEKQYGPRTAQGTGGNSEGRNLDR